MRLPEEPQEMPVQQEMGDCVERKVGRLEMAAALAPLHKLFLGLWVQTHLINLL
jgi:hypothetical protein